MPASFVKDGADSLLQGEMSDSGVPAEVVVEPGTPLEILLPRDRRLSTGIVTLVPLSGTASLEYSTSHPKRLEGGNLSSARWLPATAEATGATTGVTARLVGKATAIRVTATAGNCVVEAII